MSCVLYVQTLLRFPQTVNNLATETKRVMGGNHSRKTAAFVRVGLILNPYTLHAARLFEVGISCLRALVAGVCGVQFHHHPVSRQHLQPPTSVPAFGTSGSGQSVPFPG